MVCGVAVAAAVGLLPVVNHVLPIALWMLVIGVGSGAMTLYFQITISEASRPEERGSALALGGLGWSVSHLSTPLVMGLLADRYGIVERVLRARRCARSPARWRWSPDAPLGLRRGPAAARRYAALNIPGSREWRSSRR